MCYNIYNSLGKQLKQLLGNTKMKTFQPSIVILDDVTCNTPRSSFENEQIEKLAKSILKVGGTITPPLLRKTGIDSYVVVEGAMVYWAAKRVEEMDSMKGESINCYVVETDEEQSAYTEQFVAPTPAAPKEMTREEKVAMIAKLAAELA